MDFGVTLIIVAIVALVLMQLFFRKPKPERLRREIVQSLLAEVRLNRAMIEVFHRRQKAKKLETVSWQRNKAKLDFLRQSLQSTLSDAFDMAGDFNQQVEVAKKHKSASYLADISVDKLREPFDKSKLGLEKWLLANIGTIEPPPKYPGLLDGLFGGRR
ncbi:hypothetical protein ACFLUJ_03225 [Chloroflexota bacterium]